MQRPSKPIPVLGTGVGLKPDHYHEALKGDHGVDFFEVHAENFMGAGGPPHRWLTAFREKYPLSIHGVCLSIGGSSPLELSHLQRLKILVDRYQPELISEHLAWSSHQGVCHNDLLPTPLTLASFEFVKDHVDQIQEILRRKILVENPSLYLTLAQSDIPEPDFLNELAQQTGCGLLLDVNNVYVSAHNTGFSVTEYIETIKPEFVEEIHLAGHVVDNFDEIEILVDNHGAPMCEDVVTLYQKFVELAGPRSTLIEWDTDIPQFSTLITETNRARTAAEAVMCQEAVYA